MAGTEAPYNKWSPLSWQPAPYKIKNIAADRIHPIGSWGYPMYPSNYNSCHSDILAISLSRPIISRFALASQTLPFRPSRALDHHLQLSLRAPLRTQRNLTLTGTVPHFGLASHVYSRSARAPLPTLLITARAWCHFSR
eukprot:6179961-Pleurochrysis_carterae.AAC.5